jgi:hypothetical protein
MAKWPAPVYRVEVDFNAPRDFAFRWCTDYRDDDASRSQEKYERRLLSRTRHRVIFEDIGWTRHGWIWRHYDVRLRPPGRWRAETFGSFRTGVIDYAVTPLPNDRCRFSLSFHRRPSTAHPEQPTKHAFERELTRLWTNYGRALARDYRASLRAASRRGRTDRSGRPPSPSRERRG